MGIRHSDGLYYNQTSMPETVNLVTFTKDFIFCKLSNTAKRTVVTKMVHRVGPSYVEQMTFSPKTGLSKLGNGKTRKNYSKCTHSKPCYCLKTSFVPRRFQLTGDITNLYPFIQGSLE